MSWKFYFIKQAKLHNKCDKIDILKYELNLKNKFRGRKKKLIFSPSY